MANTASKTRKRPQVTGLRLDRELIRKAKYRALDEQTTLTKIVEQAITAYLRNPNR